MYVTENELADQNAPVEPRGLRLEYLGPSTKPGNPPPSAQRGIPLELQAPAAADQATPPVPAHELITPVWARHLLAEGEVLLEVICEPDDCYFDPGPGGSY